MPPTQAASAKNALQLFYCQLCSKGYSRINDYEAHLSSYDHSHKQRMKDMKAMVRDPNAAVRARKAEAKANGIVAVQLNGDSLDTSGTSSFKRGGFKKSMQKPGAPQQSSKTLETSQTQETITSDVDVVSDDENYDRYDPYNPTN
ncbi:hypothetical protein TD95_004424 [Thielaviopsis punctulata]|uniref:C2H2-type domain-containing protein n=1 Tax=Thielaviopsis punctulata TaxID=72032 RepID=A0A0F4ZFD3_9PEZI|nr:hypothetical protein TD95_004424 [Thielaviopsis punctulata]